MGAARRPDDESTFNESTFDLSSLRPLLERFTSDRWIIVWLFIFSLLIHIMYRNASLYHFDSIYDTLAVERTITDWKLYYSYGWGAPGMVVLVSIVYFFNQLLTGTTSAELAYTIVNILSASIAIPIVFLLSRYLTKDRFISVWAALFFSVMPIWLSVTTYPKTHAMAIVFGISSMFFFLHSLSDHRQRYLVIAGVLSGFGIAIRPFNVFYLFPMAALYFSDSIQIHTKKVHIDRTAVSMKTAALFFIPMILIWYLLFFARLQESGGLLGFKTQLSHEQREGWQGFFSSEGKTSFDNLTKTIGIAGWLAAGLGIVYSIMKKKWALLAALLLWGGLFFFYLGNLLPTAARFIVDALVPLAILMAMGVRLVHANQRWIGIGLAVFLLATMFMTIRPIIKERADYSGPRGFAEFVRGSTEPDALIVSSDEYVFIQRYADRATRYWIEGGIDEVREALQNGTPVYAMETSFAFTSPQDRQRMQNIFNFQVIGEAKNENYQFSELEHRFFNEKLMKVTLREQPSSSTSSPTALYPTEPSTEANSSNNISSNNIGVVRHQSDSRTGAEDAHG